MAIKVETPQGPVRIADLAIRDKTPAAQEADKFLETLKTELVQEDFPPTPKRRRTVKEEDREPLQDDDHEEVATVKVKATAAIPTPERKKATPKTKKTPVKKESSDEKSTCAPTKAKGNSESKRGPKNSFTAEQDAYIVVLRQSTSNATEVWKKFEEKFDTGKNEKALHNRWFAIKDDLLLSGEQKRLLMEIIEEVQGDIAASIVEKFARRAEGCKVTKAYVQKKMKEFQEQGGKVGKKADKVLKEEQLASVSRNSPFDRDSFDA